MKKTLVYVGGLLIIIVALVGCSEDVEKIKEVNVVNDKEVMSIGLSGERVNYFENANGYLAKPSEEGVYPGLILIHEWWGLNDNIKNSADRFAGQGYVALAVDLYNGEVTDDSVVARVFATSVRADMEGAFDNLRGAVEYLENHPNVEGNKLASVGWCFGGGWSYEMAKNDLGIEGSVIYYGQFNPEDDLSKMRSTILGHFGEDDASIKVDDVKQFQAVLNTLSGDHQVFIYPNSGHAFANEDGQAYVSEASDLAWQRTLEFLDEELK